MYRRFLVLAWTVLRLVVQAHEVFVLVFLFASFSCFIFVFARSPNQQSTFYFWGVFVFVVLQTNFGRFRLDFKNLYITSFFCNVRDLCEVEFWEVFFVRNVQRFFEWLPNEPLVDCQLANLESFFWTSKSI